jgi:hypothetical protein
MVVICLSVDFTIQHSLEDNDKKKGKVKVYSRMIHELPYYFLNLGARWCGWLTPRPDRFTSGNDPVHIG